MAQDKHANRRRLADMSEPVPEFVYAPPECEHVVDESYFIDLAPMHRMEIRTKIHTGLYVDFAIMQIYAPLGEDIHVARIDCCHGTCHRHVFGGSGVELIDHAVIESIPERDCWETVDRLYGECYDRMLDEWPENFRRWEKE